MPETAVFDLDGTLLDGDSTAMWLQEQLLQPRLRIAIAILSLFAAIPLLLAPALRRWGASILIWLATAGMPDAALRASFADFAMRVRGGRARLNWRPRALVVLDEHLARGDRVVVVTAAPRELAELLVAELQRPVEVLGTSLRRTAGGLVTARHCRHQVKCAALREAGYGEAWAYAYSDSSDDRPILARAACARVVNPRPLTTRRLRKHVPSVQAVAW